MSENKELPEVIQAQILEIKEGDILVFKSDDMNNYADSDSIQKLREGIKSKTGKSVAVICIGTNDDVMILRAKNAEL